MIRFGPWRTLLAVLAGQMLVLAVLLIAARTNRLANYMSALMVVIVGMLTTYVLGYASAPFERTSASALRRLKLTVFFPTTRR